MQLDLIKLFTDIAEHQSISVAAELNHITQSAASQRLKSMESKLGVELFDRRQRPLAMTEAGKKYYQGCRSLLQEYAELERSLSEDQAQTGRQWRIAAQYSADMSVILKIKKDFEAKHPRSRLEISYRQPHAIVEALNNEEADVGILSYPSYYPQFRHQTLRQESFRFVCRPGHPLSDQRELSLEQVADYPLLRFSKALPIEQELEKVFLHHGLQGQVESRFDNIDTIKSVLLRTESCALLPAPQITQEADLKALCSIPLKPGFMRPLALVYKKEPSKPTWKSLLSIFETRYGKSL